MLAIIICGAGLPSKPIDLCSVFREAIKDEGPAFISYGKIAERLKESGVPEIRNLSILFEKIAQDEQSHKMAIEKVVRLVCPIK